MYIIHKADWLWLPILFYNFGKMTLFFLPLFSFVDVVKTLLPTQQHLQNESKVSKPAPKVL
jgi:hypothetical protein